MTPGSKPAPEDGHDARFLVFLVERPLLLVLEMRLVFGLVIGGVDIGHLCRQARLHDRKVLVGKRKVDDHLRLHLLDEIDHLLLLVGIHGVRVDGQRQCAP